MCLKCCKSTDFQKNVILKFCFFLFSIVSVQNAAIPLFVQSAGMKHYEPPKTYDRKYYITKALD